MMSTRKSMDLYVRSKYIFQLERFSKGWLEESTVAYAASLPSSGYEYHSIKLGSNYLQMFPEQCRNLC